ncbi:MAG TPA: nucleotide exchange factor GrpE [Nocardioidaceae bacterium]|nr:nucleotide exchange factor GrpE [Nocardioidaceae bacterium]
MTSADDQHESTHAARATETGAEGPQETAAPGARAEDTAAAAAEQTAEGGAGMANDTPTELVADLAKAQEDVAALTADLQRLQAEYVNYKRRVDRDRDLVKQNATFAALSALLPVLDDIDRAREHGEVEGGFKAVADSLERIVAGLGLDKFGAPGDEFDPNLHEALMHGHSPDVTTTTCQNIVQAGYRIGDRVVRPARVTVVDPEPATGQVREQAEEQAQEQAQEHAQERPEGQGGEPSGDDR